MSRTFLAGAGGRLGMPVACWPDPDRDAWLDATNNTDLLSLRPRAPNQAPRTRLYQETSYARWLVWLKETDGNALALPVAQRTTRPRMLEFLHILKQQISLRTILGYAVGIWKVLRTIDPDTDWSWMPSIIDNIGTHVRRRPAPRRGFILIGNLYDLGWTIMQSSMADHGLTETERAERFRNGLMIAFLASRPLRRENMITLDIKESIQLRSRHYDVTIPASCYKTRLPFQFPLPENLTEPMQLYLDTYRPSLMQADLDAHRDRLWLARSGAPLSGDTFANMISAETIKAFGIRLTPHDFRRCAATTIIHHQPADWAIIRSVLGHTSLRTAEKHYINGGGYAASVAFSSSIDAHRRACHMNAKA